MDWDFPITVRGWLRWDVTCGWAGGAASAPEHRHTVDQAIAAMHLQSLAHRQISALSGGQQQRAFLARSLAQKARIFLLDEPFAGLDRPSQDSLARTIRELAADGLSCHRLASRLEERRPTFLTR